MLQLAILIRAISESDKYSLLKELIIIGLNNFKDRWSGANKANNFNSTSNPKALRLIHSLVSINRVYDLELIYPGCLISEKIYIKKNEIFVLEKPTVVFMGVFNLANEIIASFGAITDKDKSVEISEYYENAVHDPLGSFGRFASLYNTAYFNNMLQIRLGCNVDVLATYFFYLFVLVYKGSYFVVDRLNIREKAKKDLNKLLNNLSIDLSVFNVNKNIETIYKLDQNLQDIYLKDSICRGKPFINFNGRFFCIRPELFISTVCDFPHYFLQNQMTKTEKEDLWRAFNGADQALEKYSKFIANRAIENSWTTVSYINKDGASSTYADLFFKNDEFVILVEIKGTRETDSAKKGNKRSLNKFITGSEDETIRQYGVNQIIAQANNYIENENYTGIIFTVVVYYARFPEIQEMDNVWKDKIENDSFYIEYVKDKNHIRPIIISFMDFEILLSLVKQGAPIDVLMKRLTDVSLSMIGKELKVIAKEYGFKYSVVSLFEDEINKITDRSKLILKNM